MDLQQEVSKIIFHFGDQALRAPSRYYEEGKRLGHNVFLKLQQCATKFTVAEPHFNGSFGKKTDVVQPDLDLVITMNNFKLPEDLPTVLEEIRDILTQHSEELEIVENRIKCSTRLVQFRFRNGIEVDLLPSPNMSVHEAYRLMARNPKDHMNYSVCLGVKQVAFIQSHPGNFVHALIRLLKLWNKSLVGLDKLYGGSSLMEVVAVAAAELEECQRQPDIVRAFSRAIDWFMKLDNLKIAFQEVGIHKWKLIDSSKLNSFYAGQLVPQVVGTKYILEQSSFVIDPANPYNDLLPSDHEQRRKLMEYASETKRRIQALLNGNETFIKFNRGTSMWDVNIPKLFKTQPCKTAVGFPITFPKMITIEYLLPANKVTTSTIIRSKKTGEEKGVQNYIAGIKRDLICAVQASLHRKGATETEKVADMKKTVDALLVTSGSNTNWLTYHDHMDVTLVVPYEFDDKQYALKVSFSW